MRSDETEFDIVCLSHLQWEETLFQRPQQIMKQLAARHRVLYVSYIGTKEFVRAILRGDRAVWAGRVGANLTYVNVPYLPLTRVFWPLRWLTHFLTVLGVRLLARRSRNRKRVLWLYYPGFYPFARLLPHDRLVYDCMDHFKAFETARPGEQPAERALLAGADIVFTGGKSLQKAKQGVNARTHCLPSGVEFDHFGRAALDETPVPEDVRDLPHPILGYFGAIDERIDFELVDFLCRSHPEWSVVFIGPLVHGQRPLPRRANFHHLGKRPYATLPGYLKAFDVCLMPFVESELTRHISPTKTPEYLAGGKPVVSTPVPDVLADYADVVRVAREPERFAAAVEEALGEADGDNRARLREKAEARSWDHIAREMERLIAQLDSDGP